MKLNTDTYKLNPAATKFWKKFCQENGIKLGRWAYCKYCYKSVLPLIGNGIVVCSNCGYGIADLTNMDSLRSVLSNPQLPNVLEIEMPELNYLPSEKNYSVYRI